MLLVGVSVAGGCGVAVPWHRISVVVSVAGDVQTVVCVARQPPAALLVAVVSSQERCDTNDQRQVWDDSGHEVVDVAAVSTRPVR